MLRLNDKRKLTYKLIYISLSVNFNNVIIMNDELIKDLLLHVIYLNSKQLYGVFINKRCQQRYPIYPCLKSILILLSLKYH